MTSSSNGPLERGLDTMLVVYSLLDGHPASVPCEQFLRAHAGWFTSPLVLFEARNILTKVYGVPAADATSKIVQFASGPVAVIPLDDRMTLAALHLAGSLGLDLTDAALLNLVQSVGAEHLATDDLLLAQACGQLGINAATPLDAGLRLQVVVWEDTHLVSKGLARILRRIQQWLIGTHPQAARDFASHTGGGSHLP